jgi:MEMO1 family protein
MSEKTNFRAPIAYKEFYPENKDDLSTLVIDSLKKFSKNEAMSPSAIIAPSASYKIALDAYASSYSKIINEKYNTVIIISPIHKIAFPYIALSEKEYFKTALGDLYIDKDASKIIKNFDKEYIKYNDKYHETEHSIELQLPFISAILGNNVKILPIIMGEQNTKFTKIGRAHV